MKTVFRNFKITTMNVGSVPYGVIANGTVIVDLGFIEWIGQSKDVPTLPSDCEIVEGDGRLLTPGLIDCHTHLVYGGNRADEWEQRMSGIPYEEIAKQGGGILSTVRATREESEEQLFQSASKRVKHWIGQGITTVEIKSGYGLDCETEFKMIRVIELLKKEFPVDIQSTFLGAHTIPSEYKGRSDEYVDLVCDRVIPKLDKSVDAVDVFCEKIAFDLQQAKRVLQTAKEAGFQIKIHAEQLSNFGGAAMASKLGAISVDHLEYLSDDDTQVLAENGTVATVLPGAYYCLRETQKPPIDSLRKFNVPIAIATDANPGSSPISNLLSIAHMACTLYNLTPEEAFRGITINAAKALRLHERIGSLQVGKQADFAIWDAKSPVELIYAVGMNPCLEVYKAGQSIYRNEFV